MQMGRIKAGPPPRRENEDQWRNRALVILIEEARQSRDLSPDELRLLAYATSRLHRKREVWRWSEREDRAIRLFIAKRRGVAAGKPFQRNDEVRELAEQLGRTDWAVYRRIERIRRKDRKCSSATARKGE